MNKNLRISNWEANLMDENGKVKKREAKIEILQPD